MRYVEAPNYYDTLDLSVFLAGGITNCQDWQLHAKQRLLAETDYVIYNPRRKEWDSGLPESESEVQIKWEHHYINKTTKVLFWFSFETLCPITLFELGEQLNKRDDLALWVGCHPKYPRLNDVKLQTFLRRPQITIFTDLDDLLTDFIGKG